MAECLLTKLCKDAMHRDVAQHKKNEFACIVDMGTAV